MRQIDLVISVWGDCRFLDALYHTWRSWCDVFDGESILHVGCPKAFDFPENPPRTVRKYLQDLKVTPSRWLLLPNQLPEDRYYLLTEADVAFLSEPPPISGNQVFFETWDGGICARSAFVLVDGATYNVLVPVLKSISLFHHERDVFDDFQNQRIRRFTTGSETRCVVGSTADEKILDEAICIVSEVFGHRFNKLNNWCWYGSFIKIVNQTSYSHHFDDTSNTMPIGSCSNHVSLAQKASGDAGVVHVLEGETLYKQEQSSWL